LSLKGQRINQIEFNNEDNIIHIQCSRDKRRAAIEHKQDEVFVTKTNTESNQFNLSVSLLKR